MPAIGIKIVLIPKRSPMLFIRCMPNKRAFNGDRR